MTSGSTTRGSARPAAETSPGADGAPMPDVPTLLAIPEKLMQANLAAFAEGMHFLNRRMQAQAEIWSSAGRPAEGDGGTDPQLAFITAVAREMADEVRELADLSRRNLAMIADAVMPQGQPFGPRRMS